MVHSAKHRREGLRRFKLTAVPVGRRRVLGSPLFGMWVRPYSARDQHVHNPSPYSVQPSVERDHLD